MKMYDAGLAHAALDALAHGKALGFAFRVESVNAHGASITPILLANGSPVFRGDTQFVKPGQELHFGLET
jgi:hypothetical protein